MGPSYECLHILLQHDLNTHVRKTTQDNYKVNAMHHHSKGILTAPISQSHLTASLKSLVDLPCLLDFLDGFLKETGDSLGGGPVLFASDHLIQLTLCPCREWFEIFIAEGNSKFL